MKSVAPINIAVVKYWGKEDEELILPCNPSISITLTEFYTTTEVTKSTNDEFFLNGTQTEITPRLAKCINAFRKLSSQSHPLSIKSFNNFPTAAGLASSASGLACLVSALNKHYSLNLNQTELSRIARLGSGSACRSLFGGFVLWKGETASQLFHSNHWPSLRVLVLVVKNEKKDVSSSLGMQRTVQTSSLFVSRRENATQHIVEMTAAIANRDFSKFSEITMKESNQLHALCMDSFPPIFYLNETSKRIIQFVHKFNEPRIKAAYSFDAGPNCFIFVEEPTVEEFKSELEKNFILGSEIQSVTVCQIGEGAN